MTNTNPNILPVSERIPADKIHPAVKTIIEENVDDYLDIDVASEHAIKELSHLIRSAKTAISNLTERTRMKYPIKLKTTRAFLAELHACEYGSFEDMQAAEERGEVAERPVASHVCSVIDRGPKTVLVIRNRAELDDVHYALVSGTIGQTRCRAANTLLAKLDEAVEIEGIATPFGRRNNGY